MVAGRAFGDQTCTTALARRAVRLVLYTLIDFSRFAQRHSIWARGVARLGDRGFRRQSVFSWRAGYCSPPKEVAVDEERMDG